MNSRRGSLPRFLGTSGVLAGIVTTLLIFGAHPVRGADQQSSSTLVSRPGADIEDVYLFPAPDNANNVVLAMDVNPQIAKGAGTSTYFDPAVIYQFKIAHTAAAGATSSAEDMVIQFAPVGTGPNQTITVYGPAAPNVTGTLSTLLTPGPMVTYNKPTPIGNGVSVFAGPRADPSFFDFAQFVKILPDRNAANQQPGKTVPAPSATSFNGFAAGNASGCGTAPAADYFSSNSYNVLSLVIELPKTRLAPDSTKQVVHVWATTSTVSGT
jgi:hypothetical protein